MEKLLSSLELADVLDCSRIHVYELVKQGMPCKRLGTGPKAPYRFQLDAVMEWLDDCSENGVDSRQPRQERRKADVYEPTFIK